MRTSLGRILARYLQKYCVHNRRTGPDMSEPESTSENSQVSDTTTWGPVLFYGVLIAVLVFFWWMVIYPHGVAGH